MQRWVSHAPLFFTIFFFGNLKISIIKSRLILRLAYFLSCPSSSFALKMAKTTIIRSFFDCCIQLTYHWLHYSHQGYLRQTYFPSLFLFAFRVFVFRIQMIILIISFFFLFRLIYRVSLIFFTGFFDLFPKTNLKQLRLSLFLCINSNMLESLALTEFKIVLITTIIKNNHHLQLILQNILWNLNQIIKHRF